MRWVTSRPWVPDNLAHLSTQPVCEGAFWKRRNIALWTMCFVAVQANKNNAWMIKCSFYLAIFRQIKIPQKILRPHESEISLMHCTWNLRSLGWVNSELDCTYLKAKQRRVNIIEIRVNWRSSQKRTNLRQVFRANINSLRSYLRIITRKILEGLILQLVSNDSHHSGFATWRPRSTLLCSQWQNNEWRSRQSAFIRTCRLP